jgi:hypothetical protein
MIDLFLKHYVDAPQRAGRFSPLRDPLPQVPAMLSFVTVQASPDFVTSRKPETFDLIIYEFKSEGHHQRTFANKSSTTILCKSIFKTVNVPFQSLIHAGL